MKPLCSDFKKIRSISKCIRRIHFTTYNTDDELFFYIEKLIKSNKEPCLLFLASKITEIKDNDIKQKISNAIFNHKNKTLRAYTALFYDIFNIEQTESIIEDINGSLEISNNICNRSRIFDELIANNVASDTSAIIVNIVGNNSYINSKNNNYMLKTALDILSKNINNVEVLDTILRDEDISHIFFKLYSDEVHNITADLIDANYKSKSIITSLIERFEYMNRPAKEHITQLLCRDHILEYMMCYDGDYYSLKMSINYIDELLTHKDFINTFKRVARTTKNPIRLEAIEKVLNLVDSEQATEICKIIYENSNINVHTIIKVYEYVCPHLKDLSKMSKIEKLLYGDIKPKQIKNIPNKYINENTYYSFKTALALSN